MPRRKEPAIPNALLDQLLAGGDASAAFDQGGLLDSLKKALTERALNAEMDHHLAGDDSTGNTRNGYGRKTVMTDTGKLELDVPRDREASFDPSQNRRHFRRPAPLNPCEPCRESPSPAPTPSGPRRPARAPSSRDRPRNEGRSVGTSLARSQQRVVVAIRLPACRPCTP